MHTQTLIAAAAAVAALFAHDASIAQEASPDTWTQIASTVSRDTVRADAAATLKAGLIESGEASRFEVRNDSTLRRAQVLAEAREARRLGLVASGEASAAPTATPAQAEAIRQAGLRAVSMPMTLTAR